MKIRNGFVSNSSTSSFVCDVCGATEAGMDLTLGEARMKQCVNGHTLCDGHLVISDDEKVYGYQKYFEQKIDYYTKLVEKNPDDKNCRRWLGDAQNNLKTLNSFETIKEITDWLYEEDFISDMEYEMPPELCPCCRFDCVSKEDKISYLYKKYDETSEKISTEMKEKFNSYDDFKEYIKG